MTLIDDLRTRRTEARTAADAILTRASDEGRDLSADEAHDYAARQADARSADDAIEQHQSDQLAELRAASARQPTAATSSSPLAVTRAYLDAFQQALDTRATGEYQGNLEERAALTTATYGAPRAWGTNVLDGPRMLLTAAGIPTQSVAAASAQFPRLTLPAPAAGVGEGVTVPEFAASTSGTVTLLRYGAFTDMTEETLLGADSGAISAAHRTKIARDLDNNLIGLINTDAGTPVVFSADVPAAIRRSIATVTDSTAAADGQLVVLAHPDNVALLQAVTSTGGRTIAEQFTLFAGALVYASSAVPTGFMLVANLGVGARFFEARGVASRTFYEPKTSVTTAATSIIGGFGTNMIAGYAQKIDVVTP